MRSCLNLVGVCVLVCACVHKVSTQVDDPCVPEHPMPLSCTEMASLRIDAWRLLKPMMSQTAGWPDPKDWFDARTLLGLSSRARRDGDIPTKLELLGRLRVARDSKRAAPTLYESSLYNLKAVNFILDRHLTQEGTTEVLLKEYLARELEFPKGSMAMKTFWYALKPGQSVDVPVWNWSAANGDTQLPANNSLRKVCVALQAKGDCISARDNFYTLTITEADRNRFSCDGPCQPDLDDTMVLIALHVASKQTPEWLWATFWWRGAKETPSTEWPLGDSWTCAAAQRQEALGGVGRPWSNYSMDTTTTFQRTKPALKSDNPCGAPKKIGNDEQLLATYNPFIEAGFTNGLKSTCVDCHAKASTRSGQAEPTANPFDLTSHPALRDFEGHIRLDYLWLLQRAMGHTHFPPDR